MKGRRVSGILRITGRGQFLNDDVAGDINYFNIDK
jgi:hypothetical protein